MKGRLTSLTGVKCIIGNQWYCTLAENVSKLNTSMKGRFHLSYVIRRVKILHKCLFHMKMIKGDEMSTSLRVCLSYDNFNLF